MTKEQIATAEAEAKRFLKRVADWRKAQGTYENNGHTFSLATPRESGAVRRASMDLTRSLAAMRRFGP